MILEVIEGCNFRAVVFEGQIESYFLHDGISRFLGENFPTHPSFVVFLCGLL